jgi:putative transposase
VLCKTLEVSESGYYAWKNREPSVNGQPFLLSINMPSQHCREDARLAAEIQQLFLEHRKLYGSPRIHVLLKERVISTVRKQVARLMRELGLSALPKRSRKPTTKSDPHARFAPNLLQREFHADAPNTKWARILKSSRLLRGWLYLVVILDLFSRMVISWAMGYRRIRN